jgi:hypothetical protein
MAFIAKYHGECGHCGEELKDTEATYAPGDDLDDVVVHLGCLIPYSTGVNPTPRLRRNEKTCPECFAIHAGECV